MKNIYADLHIHIGCTADGRWIKIPTSRRLTVRNILEHALVCKGLAMVGIVDALSPLVQCDIEMLIKEGLLVALARGGYIYKNKVTMLLGAEIETTEEAGGVSHTLIYLPDLELMKKFTHTMAAHIKNINMSSQNAHMPLKRLIRIAGAFEGIIIPAHVFTPYKSLYGACTHSLSMLISESNFDVISGIELGLSADSSMADRLKDLSMFSFVSNSDAHSLDKIAREYNVFSVQSADFSEIALALKRKDARKVVANYGLDPRLGKYHRTQCLACGKINEHELSAHNCLYCGSTKIVVGVKDRIDAIADYECAVHPVFRAPYHYQVPLEYIPGLGRTTYNKLLANFGTEMHIIHNISYDELRAVVSDKVARFIISAREGNIDVHSGGGGQYGRLKN